MKIEISDIDKALDACDIKFTERERRFIKLLIQVSDDATRRLVPGTNDFDPTIRKWAIRASLHREIMKELEKCGIEI